MRSVSRRARGFTITELLVSMAAIAVLLALLLPAVQQAREAARRTSCRNNLKQIGLALQSYHDVHQMFPINTSYTHSVGPQSITRSWLQGMLPYVDQENLYEEIDPGQPITRQLDVAEWGLELLICPTSADQPARDLRADVPDAWVLGITNYKSCGGSNWGWGEFVVSCPTGRFAGSTDGLNHGNGLICEGRKGAVVTRIAAVTDGLSNTFAAGETVAGWTKWAWWFSHNAATGTCGIPLNYMVPGVPREANLIDWENNYGFMSRHAGGALFALADGSVRFVAEDIDLDTYRALATIQGGEVFADF